MDARDFSLFDCLGRLVIDYRANDDLVASGFDMFDPADFDSSDALGYPTIRAWVDGFAGSGYRTATAFIQWIDTIRIDSAGNRTEDRELDLTAEFAHRHPFLRVGISGEFVRRTSSQHERCIVDAMAGNNLVRHDPGSLDCVSSSAAGGIPMGLRGRHHRLGPSSPGRRYRLTMGGGSPVASRAVPRIPVRLITADD